MKGKTILLSISYTNGTGVNGKGEFWADSYIKNTPVTQKPEETIHQAITRAMDETDYAETSYKGKPQGNIQIDTDQGPKVVGYWYRVKHFIADRSANFTGYAYFDAWATIHGIVSPVELEKVENLH